MVKTGPLLDMVGDWAGFLAGGLDEAERDILRRHERSGRPLGDKRLIERLEKQLGRSLTKRKPGPKPRRGDGE